MGQFDAALSGSITQQQPQGCGLAGAVGAEQAEASPRRTCQATRAPLRCRLAFGEARTSSRAGLSKSLLQLLTCRERSSASGTIWWRAAAAPPTANGRGWNDSSRRRRSPRCGGHRSNSYMVTPARPDQRFAGSCWRSRCCTKAPNENPGRTQAGRVAGFDEAGDRQQILGFATPGRIRVALPTPRIRAHADPPASLAAMARVVTTCCRGCRRAAGGWVREPAAVRGVVLGVVVHGFHLRPHRDAQL